MKKIFSFVLVLIVLSSLLAGCSFVKNSSGSLLGEAESTPKVEEMMAALAEDRTSDALDLMHPQVSETAEDSIAQMSAYIAGREVSSLEQKTISVNTSTSTSGKTRQEQATFLVTLDDGDVIYLNVVYLTNKHGAGFSSFQLVLGVV